MMIWLMYLINSMQILKEKAYDIYKVEGLKDKQPLNGIKNVLCINNDSNDIYSEFVNDNFNGENEMIEISKQIYPDKQDNYKNIKECVVKVYGNKYLESFNDNGIKVISKSIGDNNVLNEVENFQFYINKSTIRMTSAP